MLYVVRGDALDIIRRVQRGEQFAHADGIAVDGGIAPVLAGGGLLPDEGGGRHLPARHAVNAVVDKDDGDIFAARRRMDRFRHTDGGEVAVPLVDEHRPVGQTALDARRHGGRPAVRRFLHVAVEIIVRKHPAPAGRDADALILQAQLFDALRDQPMHDPVRAAGAIVHMRVGEHFCLFKYFHFTSSAC